MMKAKKEVAKNLSYHFIDSTAMLVPSQPFFSAFETIIAGMSNDVSLHSKIYAAASTYAGLGWAVGKGRDFSRKLFGITGETKEYIQQIHDSAYIAAINIPIAAGLYTAAGETDVKKIAIGTAGAVLGGFITGPAIGYSIDAFRDLTGLEPCERKTYPLFVRKMNRRTKKALAAAACALAVGAMAVVYSANKPQPRQSEQHKIEILHSTSLPD